MKIYLQIVLSLLIISCTSISEREMKINKTEEIVLNLKSITNTPLIKGINVKIKPLNPCLKKLNVDKQGANENFK